MFANDVYDEPVQLPGYLQGLKFLHLMKGDDEAPMLRGLALETGPLVVFNRYMVDAKQLEEPDFAVLWLAPVFHQLCCQLIQDSLEDSQPRRLNSRRWRGFRNTLCQHACMSWGDVIAAARREGIEWMADTLTQALLFESGFLDRLNGQNVETIEDRGAHVARTAYNRLH